MCEGCARKYPGGVQALFCPVGGVDNVFEGWGVEGNVLGVKAYLLYSGVG